MEQKELPNSTAVLVLGILSLVLCWCYGIIGLILGIIALVLSTNPRHLYQENPGVYSESSYKNLSAGRVCGIIGICIASLVILLVILVFLGVMAAGIGALPHNI